MSAVKYLCESFVIVEVSCTQPPRYGRTRDGYTVRRGAPTSYRVRLEGESRWRRVMVWCFSNAETLFVRIAGEPWVLSHFDLDGGAE